MTGRPLRIVRVLTRPNVGGPMRQAVALWHAHRAEGHDTLLVVGRCGRDEAELEADGVPRRRAAELAAATPGGLVEVSALRRRVDPLADLRAGAALRALIRAWRPDVVHTHTSKAGVVGRRAALRARVPVVAHTFHGHVLRDYFPRPIAAWLARLERRLAARSDLLFAVGRDCAGELAALGVSARIEVVPPAVALPVPRPRAEARRELGLPAEGLVLGCVGRLVPIKRVDRFVALVERMPGALGAVLGDGPLRARLQRAAGGRVRFCGVRADAAALLAAFDVLVVPSAREGLPLCVLEAAAAGVPAVGFAVPGVGEAVAHCGGRVVPVEDGTAGLARAVGEALCARPAFPAECRPERVAAALTARYRAALGG